MGTRLFLCFLALFIMVGLGSLYRTARVEYPLQQPHTRILLVFEGEGREMAFDRC